MFVVDRAVIRGRRQSNFAISSAAAQSGVLPVGVYDIWSDAECWVAVGPNASTGLTTNTGHILYADNVFTIQVDDGDRIGAICATGVSGTLRYHQVG